MSKLFSFFRKKNRNEYNGFSNNPLSTNYNPVSNSRGRLNLGSFKLSRQMLTVLVIASIAIIGFGFWFKSAADNVSQAQNNGSEVLGENIAPPYDTKPVDKEFNFPLRNEKGDKVAEFKYIVQNAELTREIVVKGQKGTAVKDRTFFILNIKIQNDSKQKIQVNTRDYIRLIVNGNEAELLAPDIHNDPVEVQPISTKFTRIGFAINDSDKNLKLQIGEIEGEKQFVELTF